MEEDKFDLSFLFGNKRDCDEFKRHPEFLMRKI